MVAPAGLFVFCLSLGQRHSGAGTCGKADVQHIIEVGDRAGEGTWSFTGGTGKLKGLKGKGTFKSSGATADATEDQVEGEYTLPEAGAAAKKK